METCIEKFNDTYIVTTSNYCKTEYMSNEMIELDLYFNILLIAERLNMPTGVSLKARECMAEFIKLAVEYNGKVNSIDNQIDFSFPVFTSKKAAAKFKEVVDAQLLLGELRMP